MRGTLDPVEAFFTSIGSIWGRVLSMFAACWAGFVIVMLAIHVSWRGMGDLELRTLALVPITWMASLVAGSLHWWGGVFLLCLLAVFFATFYLETNLFRMVCIMFSGQVLHTFLLFEEKVEAILDRPFLWVLLGILSLLAWMFVTSWRRDHT